MTSRLRGLLAGAICAIVVALVAAFDPSLFGLEWLFYDALARQNAARHAPDPRIVIVALNEKSIRSLEPYYGRPPYTRQLMAMIVDEIKRGGGKVVAFDLQFSEENLNDPEGDRAFATSMSEFPVVLGVQTEKRDKPQPASEAFAPKLWPIRTPATLPQFFVIEPIPLFSAADIGTLRLNLAAKSESNRRYLVGDRNTGDRFVPSLALATTRHFLSAEPKGNWVDHRLTFAGRTIPVDDAGTFQVRWNGKKNDVRELSYPVIDFDKVIVAALARSEPQESMPISKIEEFEKKSFAGKIVIVGLTATGLDTRPTPLSPLAAGVEIHANAIDNLIRGEFYRDAPAAIVLALMIVVTMLVGASISTYRSQVTSTIIALGVIAAWLVVEWIALDRGLVIRALGPAIATAATFVAITAMKYVSEQRQTAQLKMTFGRYVSPQILDHILAHPEKVDLGGDRRELTILFSDIRGFTSISEAAEPEEVVEMLNEYFTRMVDILLDHGGTLDKFIGDAVMGFWNAPTVDPDHARHAVECAIEMIQETAQLREKWLEEGKAAIRIGVGINTGEAIAGNIGAKKVFGYTVIGDAVNLASRLEGKNKDYGTEIIISESTLQRIGKEVDAVYLDEVKVKGKEKAVRIYSVKG